MNSGLKLNEGKLAYLTRLDTHRWLTLPLFLVGLTILFCIGIMIETTIDGRNPSGKTFSLSLLFTGVAGQVEEQIPGSPDGLFEEKKEEGTGDVEGEQKTAEKTKIEKKEVLIQMAKTEDGAWKLSVVQTLMNLSLISNEIIRFESSCVLPFAPFSRSSCSYLLRAASEFFGSP